MPFGRGYKMKNSSLSRKNIENGTAHHMTEEPVEKATRKGILGA
ncbi:unnamed protein product [marine sediment metagenome]|uniref:Uncharacterized protein n=1 Tax=marine sediment metagenome TaxID=412755 RepID=X1ITD8_9ZZZZ